MRNQFLLLQEVDTPGMSFWIAEKYNTSDGIRSRIIPLNTDNKAIATDQLEMRQLRATQ